MRGGELVTNGGRILSVTAVGAVVGAAREPAYAAVGAISFEGARFRTDIAGGRLHALTPLVGILVGSESDRERMQPALDELDARGIAWEFEVRSAHRAPTPSPSTAIGGRRGLVS